MIATLLFATYTTFGPIAQDASSLYVGEGGAIVRVDKSDSTQRMTLIPPVGHRIAAIDVDGDRLLYATAPAPHCTALPTFPPEMLYVHYNCSLIDAETDHELRSVSIFGGDDRLLGRSANGITEIAHDDDWIYWLEPSNSLTPLGARLFRRDKATGASGVIADGLIVSPLNQHPFALTTDAIYVVSAARLLRVSKSPGAAITDVAKVNADSSIAATDDTIYFVDEAQVFAHDARTGNTRRLQFPIAESGGATYPISILGVAPGIVVASEGAGWTNTNFRGWILSDLCSQTARLLHSTTSDRFHAYFIPPLSDPSFAIDSNGVYSGGQRVVTFASSPSGCERRRAAGR